jgi:hypothetical protein
MTYAGESTVGLTAELVAVDRTSLGLVAGAAGESAIAELLRNRLDTERCRSQRASRHCVGVTP